MPTSALTCYESSLCPANSRRIITSQRQTCQAGIRKPSQTRMLYSFALWAFVESQQRHIGNAGFLPMPLGD